MSISSLDPAYVDEVAKMNDQLTIIYFKNDKSRSEVSSRRTGMKTSIVDVSVNKKLILTDNLITGKRFKWENLNVNKGNVTKLTDTKIIQGYECSHYQIASNGQKTQILIDVYVTPKISAISPEVAAFYKQIKGFPMHMEMRVKSHGMHILMQYDVTELKAIKILDSQFNMSIPDGFIKFSPTIVARQNATQN